MSNEYWNRPDPDARDKRCVRRSRHVAMPLAAAPYNRGYNEVATLSTRELIVFFSLDEDDTYRAEHSNSDQWLVVEVSTGMPAAVLHQAVDAQRDRLLSGLHPSFISPQWYEVWYEGDDNQERHERIHFDLDTEEV